MGNAGSKETPHMSAETAKNGLPTTLHMSFDKFIALQPRCLLREPDSEPRFMIHFPRGWRHYIVFHDGPDLNHPVLATAEEDGPFKRDFTIKLPSLSNEGGEGSTEVLRFDHEKEDKFWFGMQVGEGANRHLERFEWRISHASKSENAGTSRWEWKLVRLGSVKPEGDVQGGKDTTLLRDGDFTSDGSEIVAVWNSTKDDIGDFHLRGSGATGELGKLWCLMALVTCICVWFRKMQNFPLKMVISG